MPTNQKNEAKLKKKKIDATKKCNFEEIVQKEFYYHINALRKIEIAFIMPIMGV